MLVAAISALMTGCSVAERMTRIEGDGGWSAERREEEIAQRTSIAEPPTRPPAAATAPLAAHDRTLDLNDVLELASRNNRRIRESQAALDASAARVRDSRGRLLPQTTGSGRYTWYSDELTNRIDIPLPDIPSPQSIVLREAHQGSLNGTVSLPLDFSGELLQSLAAAQAGYRGERARLWATTLDQHAAAVRAYFQLLQSQRLRVVTEQLIALDREQVEHADALFGSGRATKNDLLVAQVALRNAEQRLVQRNLAIDRARWNLNELLGLRIDAPTQLADVQTRPALPDVEAALEQARLHNPLIIALLEEQQRLEASASSLVRSRWPRFNGGGAIDYSSSDILQPQDVASGFVGFTWDLGTDTRREAQIAQARAAIEGAKFTLERQLRELEAALRTTHSSVSERLIALDTATQAVSQAEENLRIRQQQYGAGRAQSDDVLRAQSLLSQQRATLASALYEAHARRAELQQLIGLPLSELVGSGNPDPASSTTQR